jgi:hypothetical protein
MKYSSVREYFYKLHNLLFAIMLIPLVALVVLYWQMEKGNIEGPFQYQDNVSQILIIALGIVVVTDWLISFMLFSRGVKALHRIQSLGEKLDRYYSFTILRFLLIMSGSLTLAIGFYLTENQAFTIIAVVSLLLLLFFWPRPLKVCNDLKLKGDERTLVLYKKDRLH